VTALPTRRNEDWRYSDLDALREVWPQDILTQRKLTVAAGEAARLDDNLTGSGWHNEAVTIDLGAGATLDGIIVQARDANAVTTQHYRISLSAGARCTLNLLATGSHFGRIAITVAMGEGSDFKLGGVMIAGGAQTLEIVTHVDHAAPRATSRQVVRSVAGDTATTSYLGKVGVARLAQKTDSAQSAKALLLTRTATANLKPELEIFADDVKCAHGASVGALDANALFYLQSRGLDPAAAQALLTRSFLAAAFADLDDATAERLTDAAIAALGSQA
jgi:Fe-S cluster assembly protein SufD